jgi:hypothetical protein
MAKLVWLLVRNQGTGIDAFHELLLGGLAKVATDLIPTTTEVVVTTQEAGRFSSATVDLGAGQEPFDAAVEVTTADAYGELDPFTDYLRGVSRYVAGWRVHPTVVFDGRSPQQLGDRSELRALLVFVERRDGTTPESFSHYWYVHAGHPDGCEAENDEARANRERSESIRGGIYVQNRCLEPIGPTPWVAHGYARLASADFVTADAMGNEVREAMRRPGEVPFERWPPRVLQGYAYRLV